MTLNYLTFVCVWLALDSGNDTVFYATLTTRGRITDRAHSVKLKAVSHSGVIYFSRHRPDSDWYLNAVSNPKVSVEFADGTVNAGRAHVLCDPTVLRTVSELKYPGERRAHDHRVAIGVLLD